MRNPFAAKLCLALFLLTLGSAPAPAQWVDVNIRVGSSINSGRPISCSQGERLLRNRGFRDIRRVDCRGRFFVYRAWRSGSRFEVAINSRNGRVVDMRRIGR